MPKQPAPRMELSEARASGLHNIGEAALASGVSTKMIRHYEAIGLIHKAGRTHAGYRVYSSDDVHVMRFIKRARSLGFAVKQIEVLLRLWQDHARASSEVKRIALAHAADLEARIREMQAMQRALEDLAAHCHGDHRPQCPILDDLASPRQAVAASAPRRRTPAAARSRRR